MIRDELFREKLRIAESSSSAALMSVDNREERDHDHQFYKFN